MPLASTQEDFLVGKSKHNLNDYYLEIHLSNCYLRLIILKNGRYVYFS